jgi:hypothetical protein
MTTRNLALGLAVAAIAFTPATALAKHGDDDATRASGSCSGRSTAKLKVKPDDGRLEAEFEVDQNRNGVTWSVRLRRNGKVVSRARARTTAPSGSFSVERRLADPAGRDRITATATSPSGETCRATVTVLT